MNSLDMASDNEYGTVAETNAVRFERLLPGPIERVWSYLTDSEKRGTWLAGGPMELRVGGSMELFFHHAELTTCADPIPAKYKAIENGVALAGRVLRCEPPRRLSFTWSGAPGPDSEVMFELSPRGKDVLLVLTHRRLDSRAAMLDVTAGWHAHLGILADRLSGRAARPFWATHERFAREYGTRL
jgi:uncharacterized protein YndB with AHSA1/START domain